jgi:hypothetical protein
MGGAMYVSTVFDFHSLLDTSDQSPELSFDIVFSDWPWIVENGVERHTVLEIALLEIGSFLLKLPERIKPPLLESELSIANKASWAIPLGVRLMFQRWIDTGAVVFVVARLTNGQETSILALAAGFTFLHL